MTKHVGIVAVSYEGAALCYQSICAEAARLMGEHHHPEITMHTFPLADYLRFVTVSDWEGVAGLLIKSAEKVARAGADFAVCPANTAHEAFALLGSRSPVPWLHIVEVVADEAARRGCARLGVLGTKFLMEGKVYGEVLARRQIGAATPGPAARERINALIFDELVQGALKSETRDFFRGVVAELAGAGCDGVVMACTEIPLILRQEDVEVPLLDSTRLLARAAVDHALGGA